MNMDTIVIAIALLCNKPSPITSETCQKHLSRCILEKRSDFPNKDLLECVAEGRMN